MIQRLHPKSLEKAVLVPEGLPGLKGAGKVCAQTEPADVWAEWEDRQARGGERVVYCLFVYIYIFFGWLVYIFLYIYLFSSSSSKGYVRKGS